jgi:hypothetical protein
MAEDDDFETDRQIIRKCMNDTLETAAIIAERYSAGYIALEIRKLKQPELPEREVVGNGESHTPGPGRRS